MNLLENMLVLMSELVELVNVLVLMNVAVDPLKSLYCVSFLGPVALGITCPIFLLNLSLMPDGKLCSTCGHTVAEGHA